ncbi:hypothetical protein K7432_011275 [Basidiobolus ranarum]|uniref:FAD-binding domain-containing protein n=1 Tax=Basidiobolus ranarum TaxID=34480 RepID=A0ABR2WMK3_9FUNG
MSSKTCILISGGGIAGAVAAYYLSRNQNNEVTIIERSKEIRTTGQNIDIRGAGIRVIQAMGIEDAIKNNNTAEKGLRFVDEKNNIKAEFPVLERGEKGFSFTNEIEIMRGDLVKVLYDVTKEKAKYRFGTQITNMVEVDDGVDIWLNEDESPTKFDFVIAADGQNSKTRGLMLETVKDGSNNVEVKSLQQFVAFYTIPRADSDESFARWYNATGGRLIFLRPVNDEVSSVNIGVTGRDSEIQDLIQMNFDEQKVRLQGLFKDAGWESQRVLEGMKDARDYYAQHVAQIHMKKWSSPGGRVALIGDAAYCPTPVTGMGTTLAILGGYILAGELGKEIAGSSRKPSQDCLRNACQRYEEIFRPYVEKAQKIPLGVPKVANPQTSFGISLVHAFVGFVSWSGLAKVFGDDTNPAEDWPEMPSY